MIKEEFEQFNDEEKAWFISIGGYVTGLLYPETQTLIAKKKGFGNFRDYMYSPPSERVMNKFIEGCINVNRKNANELRKICNKRDNTNYIFGLMIILFIAAFIILFSYPNGI